MPKYIVYNKNLKTKYKIQIFFRIEIVICGQLEMSFITTTNWNELIIKLQDIQKEILKVASKQTLFAASIKLQDETIRQILYNQENRKIAEDKSESDSDQTTKTARTGRTARSTRSSARIDLTLKDCEVKADAIPNLVTRALVNCPDLQEIQ